MKKNHIIILSLLLVLTAGIITTNYANQLGALFAEGAAPNPGHALGEIEGGNDLATKTYVNDALSGISGSNWIVSGSNIYRSSGNVGIGTVSPTVKLDVVGVIRGTGVVTNRSGETRPTCNSSTEGMQWYDYANKYSSICNGVSWQYTSKASCDALIQSGEWIDSGLGFCVMKYEARKAAGDIASSNPIDPVWASINQASARAACQAIGADLITNDQWTALARNIENTASNWSNGAVGNGVLARGWAAHASYGDSWTNNAVAPSTDSSCLYNTAADSCGSTGTHLYKRTHTLSNGQTIWDLSGNVWEWNNDICSQTNWSSSSWIEWNNAVLSDYEKPNAGPLGNYTSTHGAGRYYGCTANGNGFLRGGRWNRGAYAGVFALDLSLWPTASSTSFGFRCTVTP